MHATQIICANLFDRITMASSCAQLCLRCRSLLSSKTATLTWQQSTQVRHCTAVSRVPNKILNGSLFTSGNHTTPRARQIWKQQACYYSDFTTKHLKTEAKDEHIEELLKMDVVPYKSPLLPIRDAAPVTESQMPLGICFLLLIISIISVQFLSFICHLSWNEVE